jgi:coenzyme F420 hydrogenase subunit beta
MGGGRMNLPLLDPRVVVRAGLCCGCGVCAAAVPGATMRDEPASGRRPLFPTGATAGALREAAAACPGAGLERGPAVEGVIEELWPDWGPVLELWEGHACDPEVRRRGSSGGVLTALSLYSIERGGMHGVLHTVAREDVPYLNRTVLSRGREEVLRACGSRYAPASPCDGLGLVEAAPRPCLFVGKPCDAAAAVRLAEQRASLGTKLGAVLSFFCAGTPGTRGTEELLRRLGLKPAAVRRVRYRGEGWPGAFTAEGPDGGDVGPRTMSYEESWGTLTRYKQWRCKLCPDHSGEQADIAVGDAWRLRREGDPGQSLVLVRTERGRALLRAAAEAGYLRLMAVGTAALEESQPELRRARAAVFGRLVGCALAGARRPRFRGMRLGAAWFRGIGAGEKVRSIVGAARRARAKRGTSAIRSQS